MSALRVVFYVQHLWGVGHVYRAVRVAKGLADAGLDVHLIWGGTQLSDFDLSQITVHYLPPVRTADVSFSQLLNADGTLFTEKDQDNRRDQLLSIFDEIEPDILITEAFPFGRRQMLFELKPLLIRAKKAAWKPMIVASIRDIMQEGRKEKRVEESVALVREYYSMILVHGDENLIPIHATLQGADSFADKIRYTGLVLPELIDEPVDPQYKCDVLVSVGGGAFGQALTRTALSAMSLSQTLPTNWLVSAGSELAQKDFEYLRDNCPDGMRVVRKIPQLASAMKSAKVSVSHAGYNTVADILRAGCRSVLFPYTGDQETEQLRRSQILSDKKVAIMLDPDELSAQNLAEAVDRASTMSPAKTSLKIDGASTAAALLIQAYNEYSRTHVD